MVDCSSPFLMPCSTSLLGAIAGLELVITEQDGFVRVLQPEAGEDDGNPLPRLMKKQSLNYEATLLAVMLREGLEEFDVRSEGTKYF